MPSRDTVVEKHPWPYQRKRWIQKTLHASMEKIADIIRKRRIPTYCHMSWISQLRPIPRLFLLEENQWSLVYRGGKGSTRRRHRTSQAIQVDESLKRRLEKHQGFQEKHTQVRPFSRWMWTGEGREEDRGEQLKRRGPWLERQTQRGGYGLAGKGSQHV